MKPTVLFYDIETTPLQSYHWQLGKQVIRHGQLVAGHSRWDIICITYCYNDGKPAKVLRYDKHGGTRGMIEKFDALIRAADITIGKNSDRFDTKMINTSRMFEGLPGIPEWTMYTDDLEKQMRKHFRLPSMSLDYISDELGLGGKVKMVMEDWIAITVYRKIQGLIPNIPTKELNKVCLYMYGKKLSVIKKEGKEALEKMCYYGGKDVEDTRDLWYYLEQHFTPKFNMSTYVGVDKACTKCGSLNIRKNGTRISGKTTYQEFFCNGHGGYAGRSPISKAGKIGKIG